MEHINLFHKGMLRSLTKRVAMCTSWYDLRHCNVGQCYLFLLWSTILNICHSRHVWTLCFYFVYSLSGNQTTTWMFPIPSNTALAGIFLGVSHSKLRYLGEVSLSFDVHYDHDDSIFLHFHFNYRIQTMKFYFLSMASWPDSVFNWLRDSDPINDNLWEKVAAPVLVCL